jgi:hypothetical protein
MWKKTVFVREKLIAGKKKECFLMLDHYEWNFSWSLKCWTTKSKLQTIWKFAFFVLYIIFIVFLRVEGMLCGFH